MEEFGDFMDFVIDNANDFQEELVAAPEKKRFKMVVDRIRKAEVVFALWQDFSLPGGIDFILVKGFPLALASVEIGAGICARTVGVTCTCEEQAHALFEHVSKIERMALS
jgi:hypothetical protein